MTDLANELLLACIQCVNLDAFWSRSEHTVRGSREKIMLSIQLSRDLTWLMVPFQILTIAAMR